MTLAINSPFRYAGGKFYARKLILEHLTPHSTYIEPFAGGCSIFFAKPKANKNWLNDIDKDLINCYQFIKDFPHELIASLKGEEALKERHVYYKNEFKPQSDLERAQRWFYLKPERFLHSAKRKRQHPARHQMCLRKPLAHCAAKAPSC